MPDAPRRRQSFSALQRAENSSIEVTRHNHMLPARFSALQRAENSSIELRDVTVELVIRVSVLFSEPKIPQLVVIYLSIVH